MNIRILAIAVTMAGATLATAAPAMAESEHEPAGAAIAAEYGTADIKKKNFSCVPPKKGVRTIVTWLPNYRNPAFISVNNGCAKKRFIKVTYVRYPGNGVKSACFSVAKAGKSRKFIKLKKKQLAQITSVTAPKKC